MKNIESRKKGLKTVIEKLKQRMLAKSSKVKRYQQKIEQFRQNRIFDLNQQKIYAELNWNKIIWGVRKEHNREAE